MPEEIMPSVEYNYTEKEIRSKKVAACAVSLGVGILKEMIGDTIANPVSEAELSELMSAAILSELKI